MKILKNVNKPLLLLVVIILLLDFAALDDITTGNQPSNWEEWDFFLFSAVAFSLIAYSKLSTKKVTK
jgi:hypothetical protein